MTPFAPALDGFGIGLSIAAPVGPIGALCIRKTLTAGRLYGVTAGLGAATADALYGAAAAFGLASAAGSIAAADAWLKVGGGLFLIWLGIKFARARPAGGAATAPVGGLATTFVSTFLLTLANPATILSFAAIFAAFGAIGSGGKTPALLMVGGVFAGSAAWWLFLAVAVGAMRIRMDHAKLRLINLLSGLIMLGFGLRTLAGAPWPSLLHRGERATLQPGRTTEIRIFPNEIKVLTAEV
jgi:threonine/homoserine/homoserine lactone efflux protein